MISKKDALHKARALKRALDGSDLSFLLGLNPNLTHTHLSNTYILDAEGVSLTIRYDSKGQNASVENICRYENSKGWRQLTLPKSESRYPSADKRYGFTNYQYSVNDIDSILGKGRFFLRHVNQTDLYHVSRDIQFEMRGMDRLHKRGVLDDWQYRSYRKDIEKAIMFTKFPVKGSIRNMKHLLLLFMTTRMFVSMVLDMERQMRINADYQQSHPQTTSAQTNISA